MTVKKCIIPEFFHIIPELSPVIPERFYRESKALSRSQLKAYWDDEIRNSAIDESTLIGWLA